MQASIRFGNVEVRPAERQVLLDGAPAHVGGRAFDVLLALIERRDRVVTKDELFELVWPGLVVEENNLQVHISALRKLLGTQAIATVAGRGYRFALALSEDPAGAPKALPTGAVTYLFTDVEGSSRLWEDQPQAMAEAMSRHDALCRQLIAAHHGHFVKQTGDGVHAVFEHAADAVATAVALQLGLQDSGLGGLLRVRIGLNRGADELRAGDYYGPAVNRTARVMTAAHGEQVLLTQAVVDVLQGQLPDGAALRDLGNVRLRDLSGPEHVYQLLHPRLRNEFPALRSLEATPNNLPQQLNSFIGREREMTEVAELLAQHRLVTLLAMGGIGKSRLAVQLGAQLLDRFADGVWLVELAALTDPQSVPQALATVLGLRDEPGTSLIDTLTNHLRDRQLLILLDNCEHLVDACAQLAKTLLQRTTGLRVLATSRDPLAIAGERSVPLQPLSVPTSGMVEIPALLSHEAVHLFAERARAAQPQFALDASNGKAVAEICARLDGIPLALELAAARVRVMTPQTISQRLSQRFTLLQSADRTVLPRQKTLRALIDWSYDLLAPMERLLLQRLSVFAGGWSVEAAEKVCSDKDFDTEEVLPLLCQLVEKSLVRLDGVSGRYSMLDTVRAYAEERLLESAHSSSVRDAHLAHFVEVAEYVRPLLVGSDQDKWMNLLDTERENLLAAIEWGKREAGSRELWSRLVRALRLYLFGRGLLSLAHRLYSDLSQDPCLPKGSGEHCRVMFGLGQACQFMGRYVEAKAHFELCLAVAVELDDVGAIPSILISLGTTCLWLRLFEGAERHLRTGLALARSSSDGREEANALLCITAMHRLQGDWSRATEAVEAAKRLADSLGDQDLYARSLVTLCMICTEIGRLEDAHQNLAAAITIAERLASAPLAHYILDAAAGLLETIGQRESAHASFHASEVLRLQLALGRDPADAAFLDKRALSDGRSSMSTRQESLQPREALRWLTAVLSQGEPATYSLR